MRAIEIASDLPRYAEWQPTGFDPKGLGCDDKQDWHVLPVSRNRDSEALSESNFAAACAILGEACRDYDGEGYSVESFGHWANGWFEIIMINPACNAAMVAAGEIVSALASYPVLDDDDYSEREAEAADESWEYTDTRDRIRLCARNGLSIFAARRDECPWELHDAMRG